MINTIDNKYFIQINNLKFTKYYNVKEYWINLFNEPKWNFTYYNEEGNKNKTYIFLIENSYHQAFGHWVYESGIFLQYYNELKEKINNPLKIFIINKPYRTYKKLFLDFYNIPEKDIIYCNEELKHNDYDNNWFTRFNINLPKNNICITTPIITYNSLPPNRISIPIIDFKQRIYNLRNSLLKNILNKEKKIDWLFLPRAKKQNYKPNDRIINYTHVYNFLKAKNHLIYDVMHTEKLIEQIKIVTSAKNVILDYGASFCVNGLFCENQNIFLTTKINHLEQICAKTLFKIIMEKNNVYDFDSKNKYIL